MEKDLLDKLIEEAVNDELNDIEVPDGEHIWHNIEKKISKESRRSKFLYYKKIGLAAIFIGVLLFFPRNPIQTDASYLTFLRFISDITQGKIKINSNSNINDTKINNDMDVSFEEYRLSFNEAKKMASFIIEDPTYIPTGYSMKEVLLKQIEDITLYANLIYTNGQQSISLTERKVSKDFSKDIGVNTEDVKIESINRGGSEYIVLTYSDGSITIIFNREDIEYTLQGNDQEELLKMALSL